jgi:hypothetical protein
MLPNRIAWASGETAAPGVKPVVGAADVVMICFGMEGRLPRFVRRAACGILGVRSKPGQMQELQRIKVFWFFFSKKNVFFSLFLACVGGLRCAYPPCRL